MSAIMATCGTFAWSLAICSSGSGMFEVDAVERSDHAPADFATCWRL